MKEQKSSASKKTSIIETILILVLIVLILFVMVDVYRIQGTARVVNYAGIVRGATQRLVKLEISGNKDLELEASLEQIIRGLKDGSEELKLVRLEDADYQKKLTEQSEYWEELKDEIDLVREIDPEQTDIIAKSETYFELADATVSAAEDFSQERASRLSLLEVLLVIVMGATLLLLIREGIVALRLARANHVLNQKAYVDLHTGLPNKSRCEELIKEQKLLQEPTCCIMFDMNGLKTINDTLGHVAGDTQIANFATIIRNTVPEQHFVGRYGGDEFIVILTNVNEEQVEQLLADIEKAVDKYNRYDENKSEVGISLSFASGYALSTAYQDCTMQVLLDKADHNMYRNKKHIMEQALEERMETIHVKAPDEEKSLQALIISNVSQNMVTKYSCYNDFHVRISVGQTFESVVEYAKKYIVSEKDEETYCKMHQREFLLANFSDGNSILTIEYQLKKPDGKIHWVRNVLNLITDPRSRDVLLYEYCYDINRIKNIEKMMKFAVSDGYDMIGCVNFRDGSASFIYGGNSYNEYGADYIEEDYKENFENFASKAVVENEREYFLTHTTLQYVEEQLEKQPNFEFQFHMHKNDEIFIKKTRFSRFEEEQKMCIFTQVDITNLMTEEEKKQELLSDALSQAEEGAKAKTDFLSRMSHDIRTPMNTIIGMTALARDEINDPNAIEEYLEKINTAGSFLLGLVNDCLDLEKIESHKMVLKKERYAYSDFLNAIRTMFIPLCKMKNIEFIIEEGTTALDIMEDRVRFEQIFFNLLSNSVKYTPEGGTIWFRTIKNDINGNILSCDFEVRDTGIGMSEEFQRKMFEPFEQESNAIVTRSQGSGLGLAIVKNIIEMMNGSIEIHSKIGEGTSTIVHLDMVIAEKEEDIKPNIDKSTSLASLSGKRVLLFEDHPLNTEIAKKLLNKKDMIVVCAANGQEGVDIFATAQENYFDCILMDIRMPIMNGLEAAQAIRALDRADAVTIPIIAMSANAYQEDVNKSLEVGMNAHLTKPIDPKILYETLATYLK